MTTNYFNTLNNCNCFTYLGFKCCYSCFSQIGLYYVYREIYFRRHNYGFMTNASIFIRWTAIGWPRNIGKQMEQTEIQLAEDTERFHKLQLSDQATFEDRLDTLQVSSHISRL